MKRKTKKKIEAKLLCYKNIVANYIFDDFCYRGFEETLFAIEKYRGVLKAYVKALNAIDKYPWSKEDLEKAISSYSYSGKDSIEGNLQYISDRFSCQFRLLWMLGIKENFSNE